MGKVVFVRILPISDVHLEFRDEQFTKDYLDEINSHQVDFVCVAGDVHPNPIKFEEFIKGIKCAPVKYVHGNHDFYGGDMFDDFFEDDLFVGGALWTNFFHENVQCKLQAVRYIADFRAIKNINVGKVISTFNRQKSRIFNSENKLVLTHFAPSFASCDPKFKGDVLNGYFMNDLDKEIMSSNKKLWIHGHVHNKCDYMIGDCRVYANPLGYPREIKNYKMEVLEI